MRRHLVMTVGLPGSGKSTWARGQRVPVVCPDAIRLAYGVVFEPALETQVWATARTMVSALFHAGHHRVILDATNLSRTRRDEWAKIAGCPTYIRQLVLFPEDYQACVSRRPAIPIEVMRSMAASFCFPGLEEGLFTVQGHPQFSTVDAARLTAKYHEAGQ